MFDGDQITALLATLSPHRRAVVAFLAARRIAVVADPSGAEANVDDLALLASDASNLLAELATAATAESTADVAVMRERLEARLGPEGEEEEEPGELVPSLLFDAVSILNFALRTWAEPERSQYWAFTALSACDTFTYQLDHSKRQKPGSSVQAAEVARQLADLEAVNRCGDPLTAAEFAAFEEASRPISTLVQAKFRTIAAAEETAPRRHIYANGYVAPLRIMMYRDALATKGMPAHTLLFTAAEPDQDGPQVLDDHRLLTIGTGGTRARPGRFCVDCDSGWVYFVAGGTSRAVRVSGMPSAFAALLEEFDRVAADTTADADTNADPGPAAAAQLMASVTKIDPTVERFETAFWDSVAIAVAAGAYVRR